MKQAPFQTLEVEPLLVEELAGCELTAVEERGQHFVIDLFVLNLAVVGPELLEQSFVGTKERRRIDAARIPEQHDPAGGPEDSREFLPA